MTCPRCHGYCTNGAECGISQIVGKPHDWRRSSYLARIPRRRRAGRLRRLTWQDRERRAAYRARKLEAKP